MITGSDIKKFRTARAWTQSQLASALGANQSTIAKWEKGQHPIKPHIAYALQSIGQQHPPKAAT